LARKPSLNVSRQCLDLGGHCLIKDLDRIGPNRPAKPLPEG
jgi:hypothetical protein